MLIVVVNGHPHPPLKWRLDYGDGRKTPVER
jgi:hypothetical protein